MTSGAAPALSLSYAGDLVAVAWSWRGSVGIDVELMGQPVDGVDRRAWTRREALFKAGDGEHPLAEIAMPEGYVGVVVGRDVSWRLAGPGAQSR